MTTLALVMRTNDPGMVVLWLTALLATAGALAPVCERLWRRI